MKRFFSSHLNFIPQPTWRSHPHLLKRGEIIPGTSVDHYRSRIDALSKLLPSNSLCVVLSYPTKYSTQNIFYPFQQNNDLLYLTGFNDANGCLMIQKSANSDISLSFFTAPNDDHNMIWSGPVAGLEGVKDIFGFQNVFDIKEAPAALKAWKGKVFASAEANSPLKEHLKDAISASEMIQRLRLIKTTQEISLMRTSNSIASSSFIETMKFSAKEALNEAQVAAFFDFKCKSAGTERLAYVPVVAGGNRGLVLHYTHNNQVFNKSKDMLLMDAGALYFGYCSDITRTWPLSGRFSSAQRRLYEAVLNVQKGCLDALKRFSSRLTMSQWNDVAVHFTAIELDRLNFRRIEQNIGRWFPHAIGHHLGMDVHDCPLQARFDASFVAGNVLTCEPGLYIPNDDLDAPEEFRGLAIRIEDDVLVQENGIEHLTVAPKEIEAIESLINS